MTSEEERLFLMLRRSLKKQILLSSEKVKSDFITAVFLYDAGEEHGEIEPQAEAMFEIAKTDLDTWARKYKKSCEKNKARRQAGLAKAEAKGKILDIVDRYYITDLADGIEEDPEELEKELQNLEGLTLTQLENLLARLMQFDSPGLY